MSYDFRQWQYPANGNNIQSYLLNSLMVPSGGITPWIKFEINWAGNGDTQRIFIGDMGAFEPKTMLWRMSDGSTDATVRLRLCEIGAYDRPIQTLTTDTSPFIFPPMILEGNYEIYVESNQPFNHLWIYAQPGHLVHTFRVNDR